MGNFLIICENVNLSRKIPHPLWVRVTI